MPQGTGAGAQSHRGPSAWAALGSSPALCPVLLGEPPGHALGMRERPSWLSADGIWGLLVSFTKGTGSWCGACTCQLGGLCQGWGGAASSLRLTPSSPCSWPSSRRILSAAIQKPSLPRYTSPGRVLPQAPSGTRGRPYCVTFQPLAGSWRCQPRLPWTVCHCPAEQMLPCLTFLVLPGLSPLLAPEAVSREIWLSPKWPHGLSPTRKCYAAFGATLCG